MSVGIVAVGHRDPDLFGRTLLSLCVNTDTFEGKTYYIGLNSPQGNLAPEMHELCDALRSKVGMDIRVFEFNKHPGMHGFSRAVYEIISSNFVHDYYIQLAYDVFSISYGVDDAIIELSRDLSKEHKVGFVAPFTTINEYVAPYFYKIFPEDCKFFEASVGVEEYGPAQHPIYKPEIQQDIWEHTDDLLSQAEAVTAADYGVITKPGATCPFSCSMIAFTADVFSDMGHNYCGPDGEEPEFYRRYGKHPYGIAIDSSAFVAHFCYGPAYNHMYSTSTATKAYSLVDRVLSKRLGGSKYCNELKSVFDSTKIGNKVNLEGAV